MENQQKKGESEKKGNLAGGKGEREEKKGKKGRKEGKRREKKRGRKGAIPPNLCIYLPPPQYLSLGESAKPKKNQKMEIWRGGVEKGNEAPGDHPCPSRNLGEMSLAEGREEGRKR